MPTSKLNSILVTGVQEGASDWHIREGSPIALRVNGGLFEISDGFIPDYEFLSTAILELAGQKVLDLYLETGDSDFAFDEDNAGRFRANIHSQRGLLSMTFRHVKSEVPPLEALGLPEIILRIAEYERGIILVTGTTGSGKSTTMACMLEHMNTSMNRHIITVEDPIEYNFKDKNSIFEQREVGIDTVSFEAALKYALRQDPDVIVVGEMRDVTSIESALHAADTGHMVISTLHTANAGQSINRLLDTFPAAARAALRKSLAENVAAIVCQRLVPRASGRGMVPCNEVMINTAYIKKLILDDKVDHISGAIAKGGEYGMFTFDQRLLQLVNSGEITEEAALGFANNPEGLQMNLKGIFLSAD
ncbi:PilT/PilU family type 4a pilus ATPase [Lentisphaera profundi]|uniref:PilT/PilU family type 4a pilus ATPase n=1 Tax=Lentisphaera profundi TaxID=1658616 RepID=A0ABY7VXT2_9BACT|nr:PilT/PilU family type 4a pilus ATPase [Lentisphaera profundi]WDE98731.1 PilT/PilU family type 4a pilus ATPase [Lentisphaera profundi]